MANDAQPPFDIYTANTDEKGRTHWVRIGRMWPRKKGSGFSIQLQALPLTARLMAFPVEPRPKNERQNNRPRRAGEVVGEKPAGDSNDAGPSEYDYGDDNF